MRAYALGCSIGLAVWAWTASGTAGVACQGNKQCCHPQSNCAGAQCGAAGADCNCCYCSGSTGPFYICCATSIRPVFNCLNCCAGSTPWDPNA